MPAESHHSHDVRAGYSAHSVRLAWTLAAAYLLVITYASLQPFQGWRAPPEEVLRFLLAPWPRYITLQDVAVNIAAYVPLGLLLSVALGVRAGPARGAALAALVATLLSLAMEAVQMFLPSRIASNVDLLANGLGALVGALAAPLLAPTQPLGGGLHRLRHRLFAEGMAADVALVVVALWLVTHFHAGVQAFATGNLRATFSLPQTVMHTPALALGTEATVVTFNLLGIGLVLCAFMRAGARLAPVLGGVIGAALAIRLFTAIVLVQSPAPFAWLTPGLVAGLAAGGGLTAAARRLPPAVQLALAAGCVAIATIAINLAPDNPYQNFPARLLAGGSSHYLSFSGIARALSELWPLLAIGYVLCALAVRGRRPDGGPAGPRL